MSREELLERLERLPFSREDYWLITGGAMVLYGLRERTQDIDLGCTCRLADALEEQGWPTVRLPNGKRAFRGENEIEIVEDWLYDRIVLVDDIPVISLQGLLTMKRVLGREKDQQDLKRIESALASGMKI